MHMVAYGRTVQLYLQVSNTQTAFTCRVHEKCYCKNYFKHVGTPYMLTVNTSWAHIWPVTTWSRSTHVLKLKASTWRRAAV